MEEYSTADIPVRKKVDFWNDVSCRTFSKMEITPRTRDVFEGVLYREMIGPLTLTLASSSAGHIRRTKQHVTETSDQRFILNCLVRGDFLLTQNGHDLDMQEGDLAFADNTCPYQMKFDQYCSCIVIAIPRNMLTMYFPYPEQLIGVHVSSKQGFGSITSKILRNLIREMQKGTFTAHSASIDKGLMEFLAATFNEACKLNVTDTATITSRRMDIKRFIEKNLGNPDLTATAIASAFHISTRYLHALFQHENETVSCYILRRRLEECARRLANPAWQGQTVSEIAFTWGFNNPSHFGQAFKKRYDMTPREYRQRHAAARVPARLHQ